MPSARPFRKFKLTTATEITRNETRRSLQSYSVTAASDLQSEPAEVTAITRGTAIPPMSSTSRL